MPDADAVYAMGWVFDVDGVAVALEAVVESAPRHAGQPTHVLLNDRAYVINSDPLALFFDSLRRMADIADVSVALPAHGHPFTDLGGRAEHIIEHHEERLDIIRDASHDLPNGTVEDFMRVLFNTLPPEDTYTLTYEVDLNDRADDRFHVRMIVSGLGPDNAILQFASTAPGTWSRGSRRSSRT